VTIKDQFTKKSDITYSDRLQEQLDVISKFTSNRFVVAGDFNLRLGWPQKKGAYQRVKEFVQCHGLVWPTQEQRDTVQHVIHSRDICAMVSVDASVRHSGRKKDGLSDHPFVSIELHRRPDLN